jgi:hypothetical protein
VQSSPLKEELSVGGVEAIKDFSIDTVTYHTVGCTEANLSQYLSTYYDRLAYSVRKSFPPVEDLIKVASSGFDAHYIEVQSSEG